MSWGRGKAETGRVKTPQKTNPRAIQQFCRACRIKLTCEKHWRERAFQNLAHAVAFRHHDVTQTSTSHLFTNTHWIPGWRESSLLIGMDLISLQAESSAWEEGGGKPLPCKNYGGVREFNLEAAGFLHLNHCCETTTFTCTMFCCCLNLNRLCFPACGLQHKIQIVWCLKFAADTFDRLVLFDAKENISNQKRTASACVHCTARRHVLFHARLFGEIARDNEIFKTKHVPWHKYLEEKLLKEETCACVFPSRTWLPITPSSSFHDTWRKTENFFVWFTSLWTLWIAFTTGREAIETPKYHNPSLQSFWCFVAVDLLFHPGGWWEQQICFLVLLSWGGERVEVTQSFHGANSQFLLFSNTQKILLCSVGMIKTSMVAFRIASSDTSRNSWIRVQTLMKVEPNDEEASESAVWRRACCSSPARFLQRNHVSMQPCRQSTLLSLPKQDVLCSSLWQSRHRHKGTDWLPAVEWACTSPCDTKLRTCRAVQPAHISKQNSVSIPVFRVLQFLHQAPLPPGRALLFDNFDSG